MNSQIFDFVFCFQLFPLLFWWANCMWFEYMDEWHMSTVTLNRTSNEPNAELCVFPMFVWLCTFLTLLLTFNFFFAYTFESVPSKISTLIHKLQTAITRKKSTQKLLRRLQIFISMHPFARNWFWVHCRMRNWVGFCWEWKNFNSSKKIAGCKIKIDNENRK